MITENLIKHVVMGYKIQVSSNSLGALRDSIKVGVLGTGQRWSGMSFPLDLLT